MSERFVPIQVLYEQRDDGAPIVLGEVPDAPAIIWRFNPGESVDSKNVFLDRMHAEHVLRLGELCCLEVDTYTENDLDVLLAAPKDTTLVMPSLYTGAQQNILQPQLRVAIDTRTAARAVATHVETGDPDLATAWTRVTNAAIGSGIIRSGEDRLLPSQQEILASNLAYPLLRTAAELDG